MLAITKNKSKQSTASVKFSTKPKKTKILYIPVYPQKQVPTRPGVQNQLTETTFRQYLGGFVGILPTDLPRTTGKRLRYAIDTVDSNGRTLSTKYRLGGIVKSVAPDLSSVVMFNPYAKKSWTLKIHQPANKRLRLYFGR